MSAVLGKPRIKSRVTPWFVARSAWERLSVYLPVILMGVLALGTYWLARNSPIATPAQLQQAKTHEPDSYMRGFSVKTFDPQGRLKSEVFGTEARHFPDTDTVEIDNPRMRSFNARGELTVATAKSGISNGDGSEVQLIGNAVVTREASVDKTGVARPRVTFKGEFLHVFVEAEKVRSNKPVELTRGNDTFKADSMEFDNIGQALDLKGRVHGVIQPGTPK